MIQNALIWDMFSANVYLAPVSVSCYKKLYFFLNDLKKTSTSTAQLIEHFSKLQKWNVDIQIAVSTKYGSGKICTNILGWSGLHKVFYRLNTTLPCLVQTLTKKHHNHFNILLNHNVNNVSKRIIASNIMNHIAISLKSAVE